MKTESKNAKNLHKARAFSYDLDAKFLKKYIDPKTGKYYKRLTYLRDCPVCGSSKYHAIFDKTGGTYVKCQMCTMVFTNPVFTEEALTEYYQTVESGQATVTVNESPFYREIYLKGLAAVAKHVKKPGSVLDLGCGSGFFLDIAKEKKWQTTGIELGVSDAKIAASHGHIIHSKRIEDVSFDGKFDAITLWDVFEHIVLGRPYLKALKKLLSKDGVVFMQIPNSGSLAARIMREQCNMFHTLGHVSLYNPDTIALMAKKAGFKIVHIETVIHELAVLENFLQYEHPYFGGAPFNGKLLGTLTPEDIHKHKLGYKMQVVMKPIR